MSKPNKPNFSIVEIVILTLACAVLMAAGVLHAWLRNSHVEVAHEMDRTQKRIGDHKDTIDSLQVKIEKKLNIYQLRDDLAREGTPLVKAPVSVIEKIPPFKPTPQKEDDGKPAIAQRSP